MEPVVHQEHVFLLEYLTLIQINAELQQPALQYLLIGVPILKILHQGSSLLVEVILAIEVSQVVVGIPVLYNPRGSEHYTPSDVPQDSLCDITPPDVRHAPMHRDGQQHAPEGRLQVEGCLSIVWTERAGRQGHWRARGEGDGKRASQPVDGIIVGVVVGEGLVHIEVVFGYHVLHLSGLIRRLVEDLIQGIATRPAPNVAKHGIWVEHVRVPSGGQNFALHTGGDGLQLVAINDQFIVIIAIVNHLCSVGHCVHEANVLASKMVPWQSPCDAVR
mmetsp:Transcript_29705/g.53329  ORF Transcript_29705/g.53329 Transcript_29705/m.53329 type:complete len:275 (-) Transcript_29705:455-1279(-)